MEDNTITLDSLTQEAIEEYRQWLAEPDDRDPEDVMRDIASDAVPDVTVVLLDIAREDLWLAAAEPDEPDAARDNSACAMIQRNIYEAVMDALIQTQDDEAAMAKLDDAA